MSEHTPGPWFVNEENYEFELHGGKISIEDGNYFIAQIDECLSQEANARLIAAAPELLSLLKEARSTLEMWKDVAPAVSLCADIDKAIAKAKGEHS